MGYGDLVQQGVIIPTPEPSVPVTPKDFAMLKKAGVVRKPANFACSISDDRGEELLYAGKDLVSSLCSGLLTIGPRFGGALDEAAKMYAEAADQGVNAKKWVTDMKKENKLIMGIG